MGMQHCWNYTDRSKLEYSKISLSQCHCAHYKPYMDWPAICVRRQQLLSMLWHSHKLWSSATEICMAHHWSWCSSVDKVNGYTPVFDCHCGKGTFCFPPHWDQLPHLDCEDDRLHSQYRMYSTASQLHNGHTLCEGKGGKFIFL